MDQYFDYLVKNYARSHLFERLLNIGIFHHFDNLVSADLFHVKRLELMWE